MQARSTLKRPAWPGVTVERPAGLVWIYLTVAWRRVYQRVLLMVPKVGDEQPAWPGVDRDAEAARDASWYTVLASAIYSLGEAAVPGCRRRA